MPEDDVIHVKIPADLKVEFYAYLDRHGLTVQWWTRDGVERTLADECNDGATSTAPLQTQVDHGGRYHAIIPIDGGQVRVSRASFASEALARLYGQLVMARWHDIFEQRCTCAHVEGDDAACPVHGGRYTTDAG